MLPPIHRKSVAAFFHLTGEASPAGHSTWEDHAIPTSSPPSEQAPFTTRGGTTEATRMLHVFVKGVPEETPGRHGENMQTPHRKAVSTTPPGRRTLEDMRTGTTTQSFRAHAVPGGNRTHDLRAERRGCYPLHHHASHPMTLVF